MQNRTPTSILENFISEILESSLPQKVKNDALRIIRCLIYIKENMNYIVWAADNKAEAITDHRDQKNGVLRDSDGTSFHLNSYANGEEAKAGLTRLIQLVATGIEQLTPKKRLIFAQKMEWDKNKGCLEARVAPALEWATLVSDNILLNDIFSDCIKNNNGDIPSIKSVLDYCSEQKITRATWDGREATINDALLRDYLKDVFCHEETLAPISSDIVLDHKIISTPLITNNLLSEEKKIEFLLSFPHHIKMRRETIVEFYYRDFNTRKEVSYYLKQQLGIKKLAVCPIACHLHDGPCLAIGTTSWQFNKLCNDNNAFEMLRKIDNKHREQKNTDVFSLLKSASEKLFNIALILQRENGCSILHTAAYYQDSIDFQAFIAKASPEAINQALILQTDQGPCPLLIAAYRQDSTAFQALIEKASPEAINKALILKNHDGSCTLQVAAYNQISTAFQALVEKASPEAINQALLLKNNLDGWCTLHTAISSQDSTSLQALIAKASPEAINQALLLQNNNGWCALMTASCHQDTESFIQLVNKASPYALCEALVKEENDGESTLLVAAQYQSHQSISVLLQRLKSPVNALNDYFSKNSHKFFAVLKRFSLYQSGENIIAFLSLLDDDLLSKMAKELPNQMNDFYSFSALLAFNLKIDAVLEKQVITEEKKSDFSQASFLEHASLWKKPISEKLNQLKSEHKKLVEDKHEYTPEEETVLKCLKEGNALVKMVRDDKTGTKNWDDMIKQLCDYTIRQNIRIPQKPETGYKYIHIPTDVEKDEKEPGGIYFPKGKIVPFDLKKQQAAKKGKKYTGTIKTPVTLISSNLNTGLFGASDPERELVGLVFDSDLCLYKMMLTQDRGTVLREWVNSKLQNVKAYARSIQHISHIYLIEYKKAIDGQPYAVNEALAEVNRDAILGIVIGKETPKAIDIALKRQKELEFILKRKIPIVFYNPILQSVRIFTGQDQLLHETKKTIQELASKKTQHSVFKMRASKLSGNTSDQLQGFYLLIDEYLKVPSNKGFFINEDFYRTLEKLHIKLNSNKSVFSIYGKKTLSS
jgi:hypothetical protein